MGGGGKIPGQWMGGWGNLGSPPQKGVTQYAISANRMDPLSGTMHAAIFNTYRRVRGQILYVAPPLALGYYAMHWAISRNEYYNSKSGRAMFSAED